MADEHVLMVETDIPINMTIADTGFEKGTLLIKTDANTVTAHASIGQACAGVLAGEQISGSGIASAAVYQGGKFKAKASGSITVGDALKTSNVANELEVAGANENNLVGVSEESVSDGETFLYTLLPRGIKAT